MKIMGKHDAYPVYKCFDKEKGECVDFNPGDEWEELNCNDPDCKPEKCYEHGNPLKGEPNQKTLKSSEDNP